MITKRDKNTDRLARHARVRKASPALPRDRDSVYTAALTTSMFR